MLQLPVLAIVASLFLISLHFIVRTALKTRLFLSSKLPPGSLGWPVIGETPAFWRSMSEARPETFIRERVQKYQSSVFKTSLLGDPYIFFCGAAGHKLLFSSENKLVNVWWPNSVRKLFNSALLNLVGDEAKRTRRMLLTFLTPDSIKGYVERIDLVTQQHIKTYWEGKEKVKVYPTLGLYTFEIACHLFASITDPECIRKLGDEFHVFVKGTLAFPISIPGTRFYNSVRAANAIREQLRSIIRQRKQVVLERKIISSPPQDIVSHLLVNPDADGRFLTETEIVDNILLLLFAGYDTLRSASTMLIKYLSQMPQLYDKVLQEHIGIAKSKEVGELLKWEDIQRMRYSRSVVSEVMRLSPPAIGIFRQAIVDFTYEGYTIPKGWKLYAGNVSTHKDPALFPNPENFEASRFEGKGPTPYSYAPFGGGPRMCLGNEFAHLQMLIFLHNIITRFRWDMLVPDETFGYDPLLAPSQGLDLLLQPHLD